MRVLVIQTWDLHAFSHAVQVVRRRWPLCQVVGLVDERTAKQVAVQLGDVRCMTFTRDEEGRPSLSSQVIRWILDEQVDACAMIFDDRYGVRYWRFRTIPVRCGIATVLHINKDGRADSYGVASWTVVSGMACTVLRLPGILMPVAARERLARIWDGVLLVALALLAVGVRSLRRLGVARGRKMQRDRENYRPYLVVFIPQLGLGGAQKALGNLVRNIPVEAYRVEIWTLKVSGNFFEDLVRSAGCKIRYVDGALEGPFWKIIVSLTRELMNERPECLVGWLPWATVFSAVAGGLAGVPRVLASLHSESPDHLCLPVPAWQRFLDWSMRFLTDRVIACSNACRQSYIRWAHLPHDHLATVYNGINEEEVQRPSVEKVQAIRRDLGHQRRYVVGIIGRLSPEKDHPTFLRALKLARDRVPDIHALVVGEGNDAEVLRGLAEKMHLKDAVTFLGARTDALTIMASLDVLLLTSLSEGFPVVLLEAQALCVPVITTDAGGAGEAILEGETGYLVACRDSEAIADRLVALLDDDLLRRRMGQRGRLRVLNLFTAGAMADRFLEHCGFATPRSVSVPEASLEARSHGERPSRHQREAHMKQRSGW